MSSVAVQLCAVPPYSNCTVSVRGKPSHAHEYWGLVTSSDMFETAQRGLPFICFFSSVSLCQFSSAVNSVAKISPMLIYIVKELFPEWSDRYG